MNRIIIGSNAAKRKLVTGDAGLLLQPADSCLYSRNQASSCPWQHVRILLCSRAWPVPFPQSKGSTEQETGSDPQAGLGP